MADELRINASIELNDSEGSAFVLDVVDFLVSLTTKKFIRYKQNVGTSEEAMVLPEGGSLGYCMIVNRDATNFVSLLRATASTNTLRIDPGGVALFRFGSGITAPYLIADTAACQVEYVIFTP